MKLDYFSSDNLFKSTSRFFKDLNIPIHEFTEAPASPNVILKENYKPENTAHKLMDKAYLVGLVDDAAFEGNKSDVKLEELKSDYDGIIVLAVQLNKRENNLSPTRSMMAEIVRSFHQEFKFTPVVVIFKYHCDKGNLISFANCERVKYKQTWRPGEKAGKVSLLKDIDYDKPHTGHLKILQDLRINQNTKSIVASFDALYKYWQTVLDVSILQKSFYVQLADWYFWALKHVSFPGEPEKAPGQSENDFKQQLQTHRATNIIRLITRLMFTWFLKEKSLVLDLLFDEKQLASMVELGKDKDSNYYKAILQNLFFATLNQEMGKREFRKDGQNYNITNLYRYKHLFKQPELALEYLSGIPFLNGGLFECLDKPHETEKTPQGNPKIIRVDGFSDRDDNPLSVPNFLFFGNEQTVDLSEDFGSNKKQAEKVKGLIHIFNSFKFTIDENTPIEEEVALDPELLGKVFENLLASYNPETQTTARKQTGSFYTPREIVNYMVDESLIAYLKNQLVDAIEKKKNHERSNPEPIGDIFGNKPAQQLKIPDDKFKMPEKDIEKIDEKLHTLLEYNDIQPFENNWEIEILITAIDNVKLLDPACGSGAFPMGALHKMVHVLHKLDPQNQEWKERQIDRADKIEDAMIRDKAIEDIEESFENNELDYGRKLYLIENCIFGIDIQPIAVQIAKLRFFITLIVDQKIKPEKDNLGIRPLPNLETKFISANTLIGLQKPNVGEQYVIKNLEIKKKEEDLAKVRHYHFNAKTPKTKREWQEKDKIIRGEIAQLLIEDGWDDKIAEMLANWDPYNINVAAPFFDREWMFNIEEGFSIVIGNPPYLESRHPAFSEDLKSSYQYNCFLRWGMDYELIPKGSDLLSYFFEVGMFLIKRDGIVVYITQNAWLNTDYGKKNQLFISKYTNVTFIVDSDFRYFPSGEGPNINTVITFFEGTRVNNKKDINFINLHINISNFSNSYVQSHNNVDNENYKIIKFKQNDPLLKKYKWGILHSSNNLILELLKRMEEKGKTIDKIPSNSSWSFGQGLNLSKSFLVQNSELVNNSIDDSEIFKFFTSEDGALYNVTDTNYVILNKKKLSPNNTVYFKKRGYSIFDPTKTKKIPPLLILPRGISKHYCALNEINAYSASCVDVYCNAKKINMSILYNLFVFFNSSIFWLLREISGRKNLGGGLLKSEAADLKIFPVYFDLNVPDDLLLNLPKTVNTTINELSTDFHKDIDDIVFTHLDFSINEREASLSLLKQLILKRENKSKT